jgi:hypothetical protein
MRFIRGTIIATYLKTFLLILSTVSEIYIDGRYPSVLRTIWDIYAIRKSKHQTTRPQMFLNRRYKHSQEMNCTIIED